MSEMYCRDTIANVLSCVELRGGYQGEIVDREVRTAQNAKDWLDNDMLRRQLYLARCGWKTCMEQVCSAFQIGYPSGANLADSLERFPKQGIANVLALVDSAAHPTTDEIQAALEADIASGWLSEDIPIVGDNSDWALGFEKCIETICYTFGIEPWSWELLEEDHIYEFMHPIPIEVW